MPRDASGVTGYRVFSDPAPKASMATRIVLGFMRLQMTSAAKEKLPW